MASIIAVQTIGADDVARDLTRLGDSLDEFLEGGIFETLEEVRAESLDEVPVDQAHLRNTSYVVTKTLRDLGTQADPGADSLALVEETGDPAGIVGYSAEYALPIHENPRAGRTGGRSPTGRKYKSWATVGKWKYLEQPFFRVAPRLPDILRTRFDRWVRRG